MAEKRMLADVLWDAANVHLCTDGNLNEDGYLYSCEAIASAAKHAWADPSQCDYIGTWSDFVANHPAMHFVQSLGCNPKRDGMFAAFAYGEERQGVRYMWLLLAMHVAEDEGLPV